MGIRLPIWGDEASNSCLRFTNHQLIKAHVGFCSKQADRCRDSAADPCVPSKPIRFSKSAKFKEALTHPADLRGSMNVPESSSSSLICRASDGFVRTRLQSRSGHRKWDFFFFFFSLDLTSQLFGLAQNLNSKKVLHTCIKFRSFLRT